jgi:hypothetical protein
VSAWPQDVRPGARIVEDQIIDLTDQDRLSFAIGYAIGKSLRFEI